MTRLAQILLTVICLNFSAFAQNGGDENTLAGKVQKAIRDEQASQAAKKNAAALADAVCPDPKNPCRHKNKRFDVWELSFKMPAKLAANKTYESAQFYAVILKKYDANDDCDGGEYRTNIEKERKFVQQSNRARKVFAEYSCPNMSAVDYFFVGKMDAAGERRFYSNYIAIHAGETLEDAKNLLKEYKTEFPKAEIKRMKAQYEWIVQ